MFLFHRKDGLSHDEFCEHYLEVHAPLGMRLTQTMAGYSVNLVDADDDAAADAITEVWTATLADFFDTGKSFTSPEAAAELMTDHDSFIGPYDTYVVEEHVVRGRDNADGGAKRIACYLEGEVVPEPAPGVTDVLEHRVVQALNPDAPPYATIVSTWAPSVDALGPPTGTAYDVREHRKLLPTA